MFINLKSSLLVVILVVLHALAQPPNYPPQTIHLNQCIFYYSTPQSHFIFHKCQIDHQ